MARYVEAWITAEITCDCGHSWRIDGISYLPEATISLKDALVRAEGEHIHEECPECGRTRADK